MAAGAENIFQRFLKILGTLSEVHANISDEFRNCRKFSEQCLKMF